MSVVEFRLNLKTPIWPGGEQYVEENIMNRIQQLGRMVSIFIASSILLLGGVKTTEAQPVVHGYNNGPIWEVKSDTNTVYLLGSLHILNPSYYPLTRSFYYAYYDSPNIVFEVDANLLNSKSFPKRLLKKGTYPKGQSLKKNLSRKSYQLLSQRFKTFGVNLRKVNHYKPWLLYLMHYQSQALKLGYAGAYGVDNHFFRKARAVGKKISGLESIDYHISVLDRLSPKTQEALLLETIKEPKEFGREFKKLVKTWHAGDVEDLEFVVEDFKDNPEVHKILIQERNEKWFPQIQSFLTKKENYLVIVGAAHLVGDEGLVNMLLENGYDVRRMDHVLP